jgi:hypothetical protein
MHTRSFAVVAAAAGALIGASVAGAATLKNGSPNLADYRGTPVAVVFFHPL